jgi:hypothetical protein
MLKLGLGLKPMREKPYLYDPVIKRGLLCHFPFRDNAVASFAAGARALSTETVDADGTFVKRWNGLITQATANTARIEHTGVVCEGARTNLALFARSYTGTSAITSAWALTNGVVRGSSAVCHDGTTRTVNTFVATSASATIVQDCGTSASAKHSTGFWIKRKTGTGAVSITIDNGGTWTAVTVTASWTRVKRENITVANPDIGIKLTSSGDAVYLDYAQCEVGVRISSDIPTTSAAVARAAEDLEVDNTGEVHARAAAGTIICAVTPDWDAADIGADAKVFSLFTTAGGNNGPQLWADPDLNQWEAKIFSGGSAVADLASTSAPGSGITQVLGVTWKVNDFRLYVDGAEEANDTSGSAPAAVATAVFVGQNQASAEYLYGNIAHLLIYSVPLSASQILAQTIQIQQWMGV